MIETGDEFDQFRRQAAPAEDDEYAQYARQHTHEAQPHAFDVTPQTRGELSHTQTGSGTDLGSRSRQIVDINPFTAPLATGESILNETMHPFSIPTRAKEVPGGFPQPDYSQAESMFDLNFSDKPRNTYNANTYGRWRQSPNFFKQAATSTADVASGATTPPSLALMGLGGLTSAAPEIGIVTKPLMGAAGAGFGVSGAKDIYDVTAGEERDRPLPERVEKGLMGGAQLLGGAAGLGETSVRGAFNRGMDIRGANQPFTPRELYDTATAHGINLDLADATGRPLVRNVKQGSMYGLAGSGPFERNLTHNMSALDQWGTDYLDHLSPWNGEAAGARIQEALRADHEMRRANTRREFEDLDRRVGPNSIDGMKTVQQEAIAIRDANSGYYEAHPELVPRQAWKIVDDLAEKGRYSWAELHQLRTDLMDTYRNNPEIIKSQEQAWLQRLVRAIDDTMTGAASRLQPRDVAQFRNANQDWETLKATYDNPAHPLYQAVRNPFPSKVAGNLLGNGTPEFARQLRGILGAEYGDLQRAATENVLGQNPAGGYDFKGMIGRLSKMNRGGYLDSLLGGGLDDLQRMARIGQSVMKDYNPSGTAKTGQKMGQMAGLVSGVGTAPTAAWLGAERGIASGMNAPGVTRFLTDPDRAPALPRGLAIAAPAAGDDQEMVRHALEFMNRRRRPLEMAGQ